MPPASPIPRLIAFTAALVAALALPVRPAHAESHSYRLDPVHSRVLFQISHAGFSEQPGFFSGVHGTLEFDERDWSKSRLQVQVPVASLQLGDSDWNRKILDRTFLDASKFPEARFVSTQAVQTGEQEGTVTGDLTLRGITRPVTLAVKLNAIKRHPLTLRRTAGFSATSTLRRSDFGIDSWKNLVGDQVRLVIEIEATRSGEAAAEPQESDDAPAK